VSFTVSDQLSNLPLGGIGMTLLAISIRMNNLGKVLSILTPLTFGIYLSHVIFLEAFEFGLKNLAHSTLNYDLLTKTLVSTSIFAISALFIMLIKQSKSVSRLLLGEQ
jgi:surface polysaccharide O-acyltransferase-like enzyme